MVDYRQEPTGSSDGLTRALITLVIGVALTFAAGLWVSQIPQTRGELIAELAQTDSVVENLTVQVQQANAQTDQVIASLANVTKGIQALIVDDKTKSALIGSLNDASAKLIEMRSNSTEMLKMHDLSSIETPKFSLISQAEAASRKKAPQALPDPWYLRPAYRIFVAGGVGLLIGGIFFVFHAFTKDRTTAKFYREGMKGIGQFLAGLAGGGALMS
jgi:hypothetical protein